MKKFHPLLIIVWMGLGVFAMVHAYSLGLKGFAGPGPGLMPFLVGLLLLLAGLYLLVGSLFNRNERDQTRKEEQSRINLGKTGLAVGSLIAYALFMESLGYLITTTLLLIALFKGMGTKKWRTVVTVSVLTSLITFFAFTYLRLRLPMGILRF